MTFQTEKPILNRYGKSKPENRTDFRHKSLKFRTLSFADLHYYELVNVIL